MSLDTFAVLPFRASRRNSCRLRFTAFSLILCGTLGVLFAFLGPRIDEVIPQPAQLDAPVGIVGVHASIQEPTAVRPAFWAMVLSSAGAGLTLPLLGAETFSWSVIAQVAIDRNDPRWLLLVNSSRFGLALMFLTSGLVLIGAAAIALSVAIQNAGNLPQLSGTLLAIGFAIYMPLRDGGLGIRWLWIADALLILAGCVWLARGVLSAGRHRTTTRSFGAHAGELLVFTPKPQNALRITVRKSANNGVDKGFKTVKG